jgi:FkbH-like protein
VSTKLSPSEECLAKAEWQEVIFSPRPGRYELQKLCPKWDLSALRIRVHRNQPFEFVASAMVPFSAFAGWKPDFIYSDYDDALSANVTGEADVEVVWLDFERYSRDYSELELAKWLTGRLKTLRQITSGPILISNWASKSSISKEFNSILCNLVTGIPDVYVCEQSAIAQQLGDEYIDLRTSKVAGMSMSDQACILTARMFGLVWLPSVLAPRLKAVVLDLDDTLYSGVLGEDGVHGIVIGQGHLALQKRVLQLLEDGLFIGICSRNELEDVKGLMAERSDFLLHMEHLSALAVGWQPKARDIKQIAEKLRIGTDSILFIDDNPGELAAVSEQIPDVHCMYASQDPLATEFALSLFPGLWKWGKGDSDRLRIEDHKASEQREKLYEAVKDPVEYLRSLQVELCFSLDPAGELQRLSELSNKTNQFNTALLRLSEKKIADRLAAADYRTVSIYLKDRLSVSGIIGVVFTHFEEDALFIDEICISCRSLGRGLEDFMLSQVLQKIAGERTVRKIAINCKKGPRNKPAMEWLESFFQIQILDSEGTALAEPNLTRIEGDMEELPVLVEWKWNKVKLIR